MARHPHIDAFEAQQAANDRRQRLQRLGCLGLVLLGVAAVAALVWWLLPGEAPEPPPPAPSQSSAPPPASSASAASQASSGAASSSAAPPGLEPPPPSPYDEEGLPPLFNADHPIPDDYAPDLASVTAGGMEVTLQRRAAEAYQALYAAAQEDGIGLKPISGYRHNSTQSHNFNASVQNYMNQGYTREQAEARTRQYYALPGTSEHEAGLAVDLGDTARPDADLNAAFEYTDAYAWLQKNAWRYGFIQRYHLAAESVTGVTDEPWHYRYVGANHAWQIETQRLTLEDYVRLEAE